MNSFNQGQKLWKDTCALWGKKDSSYIYNVIYNFYGSVIDDDVENYRFYHSIEHIIYMLNNFHLLKNNFNVVCPEEIELSIWFHDIVQDRNSKTNEKRSAQFAEIVCSALRLNQTQVHRVKEMILATNHEIEPETEDSCVMLDIDLAILAEDWNALYTSYMISMKNEYVPVFCDEKTYLESRLTFLRKLNDKEWIYNSKWFRKEREHIARSNIQHEISIIKTKLNELKE